MKRWPREVELSVRGSYVVTVDGVPVAECDAQVAGESAFMKVWDAVDVDTARAFADVEQAVRADLRASMGGWR